MDHQQKLLALKEVFSTLTQKEMLVISLRFGLNSRGITCETIAELAETLGWPSKGVRDTLHRAYFRIGSARNRLILQQVLGRDLTPHNLAAQERGTK